MNVSKILKTAAEILRASGVAEPRREANSLLAFALNVNQTFLIAHDDYELSFEEENIFLDCIKRRAGREPFQYITGRQEFYGLDFNVSPDVLIPRPETEMLVETAIEILSGKTPSLFCEIGVGSGCVAVSMLRFVETARAIGLDISEKALRIAARNAETHRVSERLELRKSDVYENLRGETFDLIVSNPPYISAEEMKTLQAEVRDFEPKTALTDGADGLSIIEKIIADAPRFLKDKGFLLLEIGHRQSADARKMFDPSVWRNVAALKDLQGIERVVVAEMK